jgi:hypothetical protein
MVSDVLYQLVVGQDLAGLCVHVKMAHLTERALWREGQDHRNAPANPVVMDDQCGSITAQTGANLIQNEHVDFAAGGDFGDV